MISDPLVLSDLYTPIRDELDRAQAAFDDELRSRWPFIADLCAQVRSYRGKRLRPALLLLSAKASGTLTDAHVTLAAVVEMVHVATLVHDDVLDESDVRRRRQTVNAEHGNETAVLLGDYLISHAYHLCSSLGDAHAARAIAATTNTVCEGELLQVHSRYRADLTESQYFEIVRAKTAALTACCCALGAHYAGAGERISRNLGEFGMAAGIAFQIVDDVLDLIGSASDTGKTTGRDFDLGEATLPVIHCLAGADAHQAHEIRRAVAGHTRLTRDDLLTTLRSTGSIDYALNTARNHVRSAVAQLAQLPDTPARASLYAMAEFVCSRGF